MKSLPQSQAAEAPGDACAPTLMRATIAFNSPDDPNLLVDAVSCTEELLEQHDLTSDKLDKSMHEYNEGIPYFYKTSLLEERPLINLNLSYLIQYFFWCVFMGR